MYVWYVCYAMLCYVMYVFSVCMCVCMRDLYECVYDMLRYVVYVCMKCMHVMYACMFCAYVRMECGCAVCTIEVLKRVCMVCYVCMLCYVQVLRYVRVYVMRLYLYVCMYVVYCDVI